jgi:GT2 family glycosyltransferase
VIDATSEYPGADPELSVVIVSFRCRDLLLDCIGSLESQRGDVGMEVLVVDNASGDDTVAPVGSEHPWVIVRELAENVGFARANNLVFPACRGRAVLILNPDTVLPPGSLRACLDELWAHEDVGVLTPRLVDTTGRLDRRCKRGFPTLWSSFCYFTGLDQVFTGPRSTRYTAGTLGEHEIGDVEAISGAFMLTRADALAQVGGFDEQFFMYAEDIDICLRLAERGWRIRYWPQVDVIHVGAGSNVAGRRPPAADAAYFRTMAPFIRKYRKGVRGAALALAVRALSEALLLASRTRGALSARTQPRSSTGD